VNIRKYQQKYQFILSLEVQAVDEFTDAQLGDFALSSSSWTGSFALWLAARQVDVSA